MVDAEACQVESELREAEKMGSPYPDPASYPFGEYLSEAREQLAAAQCAARSQWPRRFWGRLRHLPYELVAVWTGSEHETAVGALHRAEGAALMVMPVGAFLAEASKIEANFVQNTDITLTDPRHDVYKALFDRLRASSPPSDSPAPLTGVTSVEPPAAMPPATGSLRVEALPPLTAVGAPTRTNGSSAATTAVSVADRMLLREILRQQHESWEIARSRVRIFRNILAATIPFLMVIVVGAAILGWFQPDLIPLHKDKESPQATDLALIAGLGAFGGLLSALASLRALRNFQRFYGLPLAQTMLKLPAGSVTALAGILLLQHGILGSAGPVAWTTAVPYAVLLGIAQITVTRRIDSRANDLLGDANSKSPATVQTTSPSNDASRAGPS